MALCYAYSGSLGTGTVQMYPGLRFGPAEGVLEASYRGTADHWELRVATRLLMFWSSYAPLFLLLAIRFDDDVLRGICSGLFVGGISALLSVVWKRGNRLAADPYEVATVGDEGAAVAAYLASYILPFATVSTPSGSDIAAYVVFLAMLAVVYVRTPLSQVNPLLYMVGYRVFALRTTSGFDGYIISRREPIIGDRLHAVSLTGTVLKVRAWPEQGGKDYGEREQYGDD